MKTIKGKARERFVQAYAGSNNISLYDVYNKPSQYKLNAENECIMQMQHENGWNYRILSYNTFAFTCGWLIEDAETGELMLRVETPENSYIMEY